jgi:hypothetical protein
MKTQQLIQIAALALCALSLNPAMAHGAGKARHGGVLQVDHNKPMPSKGIAGKLTVLQGGQKTQADLKEAGDNQLKATGVTVSKGAKVVAVLNNVNGKTVTVRFSGK